MERPQFISQELRARRSLEEVDSSEEGSNDSLGLASTVSVALTADIKPTSAIPTTSGLQNALQADFDNEPDSLGNISVS
jgi:hypothetical protein